ncbi:Rieske 2Fe-2S domain-containing protein [Halopenitus sp. H-Gu1]|uniref:Rieske 2Fe-2S domain-containing protein n=1 Tax=Halopenitus sp. H-Gu1 TaxID=3242697 RepID=UPI00359D0D89
MSVHVGPASLLETLPQSVEVDGEWYIISKNEESQPVIFSSECPHLGGTVEVVNDDCLRCPQHNWEFDVETGDSTTVETESLTAYNLTQRDGELYADIPQTDNVIEFSVSNENTARPNISLLSHATLSIEYDGFKILTDPWLEGPAFLDAWTQYPPPTCDVDSVATSTDAIWITHEHPDHLNPRTLERFPDETPIYVPELNYRRLSNRLRELGFENVHSLPTHEPYQLAEGIEAVCFESSSTFNDSILAINCGGFKIVNVNDAGVNWDVNEAIPQADLVATGFSFGASGYPITWKHLTKEQKRQMIKERNEGQLQKCEQLVEMFNADYLLPFAKFFELAQPEHKPYRELIEKNRPSDVTERLSERDVTVLDLLPGETWCGNDKNIDHRANREQFFDKEFRERYLQDTYESQTPVVNEPFDMTHEELATYFESLGESDLAAKIGDFALTLSLTGEQTLNALIRIQEGEIEYKPTEKLIPVGELDASHHVSMSCPGSLVQFVVRNDRSWDDIHIGYWCEFDRQPDEYNLGFWRLLHAPWEAREDVMRIAEDYDIETKLEGTTMADLVERNDVGDILSTYGLHCAGCPEGLGEDIVEAARIHGLGPEQARRLISEIEASVTGEKAVSD